MKIFDIPLLFLTATADFQNVSIYVNLSCTLLFLEKWL